MKKNNEVKLLTLSPQRKIVIYPDNDNNYIPDNTITYQNLGADYPKLNQSPKFTQNVIINKDKQLIEVLSQNGEVEFYFPHVWLDTTQGMIFNLMQKGVLK